MEGTGNLAMSSSSLRKCFVKVVVIGDSSVGKTSIIQTFQNSKFTQNYKPTIGADFSFKEIVLDDRVVTLQIWDTAGQERFQSLGPAFYRGADCCCLVYDVAAPESLENLTQWKSIFITQSGAKEGFPFVAIGNKTDLPDRKISKEEGERYCKEHEIQDHYEASAKN